MYEKGVLTFLDILGFREIVSNRKPDEIEEILNLLAKVSGVDEKREYQHAPSVLAFSDSIVRVATIGSKEKNTFSMNQLFFELLHVLHIQGELVFRGIFLRGAITVGDVAVSSTAVFGPAFIEAYDLESKLALYPRIIISPTAVSALEEHSSMRMKGHSIDDEKSIVREILRKGSDGIWFVDYLRAFESELDTPETYYEMLVKHRDSIKEYGANPKLAPSVLGKYAWLASYHNRCVEELTEEWLNEYKTTRDDLKIGNNEILFLADL